MLINHEEYQAMYEVEENLWWYRILHRKSIRAIKKIFQDRKDIRILDAGCGTGGLMKKLLSKGYLHTEGFDFNESAVFFSKNRKLNVQQLDIQKLNSRFSEKSFDVVISNDVLYQFEEDEIESILNQVSQILKPGGIFISNNNAFKAFAGTHDIAVGSKRRFVLADFYRYISQIPSLSIQEKHYWSFLLSPLIWVVRFIQRQQLKAGKIDLNNIKSDVGMPGKPVNALFYNLLKFESDFLPKIPFGSSLFIVFHKKIQ